ncbi:hypothetical protein JCM16776_0320 [Leptotrichia shahii]|uniref:DUF2262 domain-containing protein n=1 Tax=Leptotrichia shahii TaxID=157691 RepID=A0A510JLN6_9FUSO|nr:DUF2262 domain-containing protein [Leptotrichia shahii]BBM40107.1 hypothetical protein JCM16776_0320 [Leptotrichia shahii]
MEIQDFRESSHSSYFKEWYGKVIWKGEEIRVSLTISKKCDNVELEKEKMFKILEELYLNQDEWNKKVKDTMVKYFYDVLNDDFFNDGVFPEYPTCYDMLFEILKDDFTKEEAERIWKTKVFPLDKYRNYIFVDNIQITSEGNFYFEVADDYTVVGDNWIWLKGNIDKGFFAASFDDLFEFVTDLELNDEFSSILREKFKIGYADASSFFVSRREGLTKLYYKKNHKLAAIGNYKSGKKEGIWKFYDEDGKLTKKVNYVNDIAEEEVIY